MVQQKQYTIPGEQRKATTLEKVVKVAEVARDAISQHKSPAEPVGEKKKIKRNWTLVVNYHYHQV